MADPIADLKNTAIGLAATPVQASLASIIANPSTLNVAAQGAVLQGALIGVLPSLETDAIKAFAEELSLQLTNAVTAATAAPAIPPAGEPVVASVAAPAA